MRYIGGGVNIQEVLEGCDEEVQTDDRRQRCL